MNPKGFSDFRLGVFKECLSFIVFFDMLSQDLTPYFFSYWTRLCLSFIV
jgi:hypothetical protein